MISKMLKESFTFLLSFVVIVFSFRFLLIDSDQWGCSDKSSRLFVNHPVARIVGASAVSDGKAGRRKIRKDRFLFLA